MNCRVCDSELQEGAMICPNCGRMAVSFPDPLPDALQQCLKKERAFYEQQMASGGELQHELGERKAKIDELNATVASLQKELEAMSEAKQKLESDYESLSEAKERLESDYESLSEAKRRLDDEYIALKNKYESMCCPEHGLPWGCPKNWKPARYCQYGCVNPNL
jgi:FtsZ-binding cell division protein ZapB